MRPGVVDYDAQAVAAAADLCGVAGALHVAAARGGDGGRRAAAPAFAGVLGAGVLVALGAAVGSALLGCVGVCAAVEVGEGAGGGVVGEAAVGREAGG